MDTWKSPSGNSRSNTAEEYSDVEGCVTSSSLNLCKLSSVIAETRLEE